MARGALFAVGAPDLTNDDGPPARAAPTARQRVRGRYLIGTTVCSSPRRTVSFSVVVTFIGVQKTVVCGT